MRDLNPRFYVDIIDDFFNSTKKNNDFKCRKSTASLRHSLFWFLISILLMIWWCQACASPCVRHKVTMPPVHLQVVGTTEELMKACNIDNWGLAGCAWKKDGQYYIAIKGMQDGYGNVLLRNDVLGHELREVLKMVDERYADPHGWYQ